MFEIVSALGLRQTSEEEDWGGKRKSRRGRDKIIGLVDDLSLIVILIGESCRAGSLVRSRDLQECHHWPTSEPPNGRRSSGWVSQTSHRNSSTKDFEVTSRLLWMHPINRLNGRNKRPNRISVGRKPETIAWKVEHPINWISNQKESYFFETSMKARREKLSSIGFCLARSIGVVRASRLYRALSWLPRNQRIRSIESLML